MESPRSMSTDRKTEIAKVFLSSAISQVEEKIMLGIQFYDQECREGRGTGPLGGLVCSGGVASNSFLRKR
jgi:tRNA A37 threonylcarbamoyltransferase TsaD